MYFTEAWRCLDLYTDIGITPFFNAFFQADFCSLQERRFILLRFLGTRLCDFKAENRPKRIVRVVGVRATVSDHTAKVVRARSTHRATPPIAGSRCGVMLVEYF